MTQHRPRLSFREMFNMSFGFLGIQFGWGLQLANMSAVYERLGARPDEVPLLWLAAPVTGLLVQPIVGALSDRTWGPLGRRRPYFLTGAILASIALFFMPTSSALWMAAALLWILDASINISMEPFRAFVADKLDASQRTAGFVMQSFFIGVGATMANALPFILSSMGVTGSTASGIPLTVKYSFQAGAAVFLLAVLWTVFTTTEFPPEDMAAFEREKKGRGGLGALFSEITTSIGQMPQTMKQLAVVQFFTWLGLFCMWMFFVPTVARHVFGEWPHGPAGEAVVACAGGAVERGVVDLDGLAADRATGENERSMRLVEQVRRLPGVEAAGRAIVGSAPVGYDGTAAWLKAVGDEVAAMLPREPA